MLRIDRRSFIAGTAGLIATPRLASAQGADRPAITVAVQRIATSNTLDILNEASNVGTRHYNLYKEPLIDTDWTGDLSIRPGLAESWTRIDGRTIEFTLRKGVRFHNGEELTAESVAWTFGERLFGSTEEKAAPATLAAADRDPRWAPIKVRAGAKAAYPALERIEILDRYRFRWVNRIPDVTLEGRISMRTGCILNERSFRAAKTWLDWSRAPVGTGPYRVASYKPDNQLLLEAFDDYWGGRPPLKSIRFLEVPELASRINGLLSGEYDFACDITPDLITQIEKSARHEVAGGTITNHRGYIFDKSFPALKDPRVRLAMSHAIDRQTIVETVWNGRTKVPNGLQFPFYGPMYLPDWNLPAFDPARAKALLAEAGYKGEPIPFKVLNNYYTNQVATAEIVTAMWRAVGLNVAMEMRENWGQVQDRTQPRAINDNSFTSFFNDPVSFMPTNFGAGGDMELTGYWKNDECAKLLDVLQSSVDMDVRRAAQRRILEIVERDDPAVIVLHETANFTGKRKDIAWKPARSFVMDFRSRNFRMS